MIDPIGLEFTYNFARDSLSPGCKRILEVGCGNGELAARLMQDGFNVQAIDADVDAALSQQETAPEKGQGRFPGPALLQQ